MYRRPIFSTSGGSKARNFEVLCRWESKSSPITSLFRNKPPSFAVASKRQDLGKILWSWISLNTAEVHSATSPGTSVASTDTFSRILSPTSAGSTRAAKSRWLRSSKSSGSDEPAASIINAYFLRGSSSCESESSSSLASGAIAASLSSSS